MDIAEIEIELMPPPWGDLYDIAGSLPQDAWVLVGGLMVQAHASLAKMESRATKDIDMLIDVMASDSNIGKVVEGLRNRGFIPQEPGLRGTAFHRMKKDELFVDVLIAEHLPSGKKKIAKVNRWPMLETPSGAQALERKMPVKLASEAGLRKILIPDLLGALVLKSAAYQVDRIDQKRHLEDAAFLSSLIVDHKTELTRLKGSDRKRLRLVTTALSDANHAAWLILSETQRIRGMDTLRILSG